MSKNPSSSLLASSRPEKPPTHPKAGAGINLLPSVVAWKIEKASAALSLQGSQNARLTIVHS